jgi:hypothetical protein
MMPPCDAKHIGGVDISVFARVAVYWLNSSFLLLYLSKKA